MSASQAHWKKSRLNSISQVPYFPLTRQDKEMAYASGELRGKKDFWVSTSLPLVQTIKESCSVLYNYRLRSEKAFHAVPSVARGKECTGNEVRRRQRKVQLFQLCQTHCLPAPTLHSSRFRNYARTKDPRISHHHSAELGTGWALQYVFVFAHSNMAHISCLLCLRVHITWVFAYYNLHKFQLPAPSEPKDTEK